MEYVCVYASTAWLCRLLGSVQEIVNTTHLADQTNTFVAEYSQCCATVLYANGTTNASVNYAKQLSTMKPPALLLVLSTLVCLLSLACLRLRPMHCLQWKENYKRKEDLRSKWIRMCRIQLSTHLCTYVDYAYSTFMNHHVHKVHVYVRTYTCSRQVMTLHRDSWDAWWGMQWCP